MSPTIPLQLALTPRAQPSPEHTQVVIDLSIFVTIPNFPRFYPNTSPDSFQPFYYALADGSLVAPPLLQDLRINNISLILTGCLLTIFLRNVYKATIYLWKGRVKKKGLLYTLFLSQLLGPIATIPIIVAQFSRAANCDVILRITCMTCGVSLSLLVTGILGVKAYRCLDNNRFVSGGLVALRTAGTIVFILDAINLQGIRSLSGRCYRPSAGLFPIFVVLLVTESSFICACFFYAMWKSHGPVAVRGRISVQLSLDDVTHNQPTESRKESADAIRNRRALADVGSSTNHFSALPRIRQPLSLSHQPSTIASIRHDRTQRMTPGNAETVQISKCPTPFPSTPHSHTPVHHCWTVRMPTTTDGPYLPQRVTASFKRPTSPTHFAISCFTRYIPAMSLFREVMRDELCYTAIITAFTVVSAAMTLIGVKSEGGINSTIWVAFDWALISVLVVHSFGRMIRRHENESLLLHPSAWYHDLHTDRTTAELLRDVPLPVRTSGMSSRARAHRSVARYDADGGVSTSDLSTRRLFLGSAYSSRGDIHSSAASTSGVSNMFSPIETESFSRTHTGGPHVIDSEGHVFSTTSMEDLSFGPSRSQRSPKECFNNNLISAPPPPEPPDEGRSFDVSAHVP